MTAFDMAELGDRVATLSISLLAYVSLIAQVRADFPKFSDIGTFTDNFFLILILTSLIPIGTYYWGAELPEEETGEDEVVSLAAR